MLPSPLLLLAVAGVHVNSNPITFSAYKLNQRLETSLPFTMFNMPGLVTMLEYS